MEYDDLKGTGVALVTPFDKDKNLDFDALLKLIRHVIKGKANYVVVLGTTAETATLTKEEKRKIIICVSDEIKNRIPIVLGMGGNNTQEVVEGCNDITNYSGARAFLSVSPYYNKPTQAGIYEHYKAVAKASPLPIILYNVPSRTGSNISAETTLKLAHDFDNIIGIKEASGDMEQCMKIIKNKKKGFLFISGDDMLTLPLVAAGADGVISVVANAYTLDFAKMVQFTLDGNLKEARRLHYKLTDIIDLLFKDGNPAGIKAVLEMMKIGTANLRLPLVNMSKHNEKLLEELVKKY